MNMRISKRRRRTTSTTARLVLKRKADDEEKLESILPLEGSITSSSTIDMNNPGHKLLFLYEFGLVPNRQNCPPFIHLHRLPDLPAGPLKSAEIINRLNNLSIQKTSEVVEVASCQVKEIDERNDEDLVLASDNKDTVSDHDQHDLDPTDLDLDVLIWPADCPEILAEILKESSSSSSVCSSDTTLSPSKSSSSCCLDSGYDCDEEMGQEGSLSPKSVSDDDDDDGYRPLKIVRVTGSDGSLYNAEGIMSSSYRGGDQENIQLLEYIKTKLLAYGTHLYFVPKDIENY